MILEVGGGLGVLSEYLAERTRHVHVVELDRGLEPALRDALDPHPNTTLHMGDAVKLDLTTLDPPPDKVVANLPYGVAATVILGRSSLTSVDLWVAMVQKEVGERFAAAQHARLRRAVGARPARLRRARHPQIPRGVFTPVPNVDSVLVGLKRHGPAPPRACGRSCSRASPTAARRSPAPSRSRPARTRRFATARARRWRRSATPPTRAPSRSRPRSGGALWERLCP